MHDSPTRLRFPMAALTALALLAGLPASGSALTLDVLAVGRSVDAHATSYCPGCGPNGEDEVYSNGESQSSALPGVFDEDASSLGSYADQMSEVSSAVLSGQGSIGLGGSGDNDASSYLSVDFQVASSGTYGLLSELDVFGYVDEIYIEITEIGGVVLRHDYDLGVFQDSFQLQSGTTYTLRASITGYDYTGTSNGGSWAFTLVPEPGTGLLLSGGLIALAARPGARQRGRSTTNHSTSWSRT